MTLPLYPDAVIPLPTLLTGMRRISWPSKLGFMDLFWRRKLSGLGVGWFITANGLVWKLDPANATHRWLVYGDYQGPNLRRWATAHLPARPSLVLSGANIGQMVASLHPLLQFSRILAFEPDKEASAWLGECHARHPGIPMEIVPAGLGAENGRAGWVHADWSHSHGSQSRIDPSGSEQIPIIRLEDCLEQRDWKKVDLWILDVEGAEALALAGAGRYLQKRLVGAIFMEVDNSDDSRKAVQWLSDCGYTGHHLNRTGHTSRADRVALHGDLLFLPN